MLMSLIHLPESALLGVVPALVLMFIKSPVASSSAPPDRLSCPRCAKVHSGGQHFCTGCGWDLSTAYAPDEQDGSQVSPTQPQAQSTMPSSAVVTPPEAAESPVAEHAAPEPPVAEPTAPETETAGAQAAPAAETPQESAPVAESIGEGGQPAEADAAAAEEAPVTEAVPWGTHDPGPAPTAAVMTARGVERFDAGKFQEAIDQFTKAIALDPDYVDAWQRRAEAYAQLGRSAQAEEDRRHLQSLDTSSSPG